jgi:hypothetical protein
MLRFVHSAALAGALLWPFAAQAQVSDNLVKIGVLERPVRPLRRFRRQVVL